MKILRASSRSTERKGRELLLVRALFSLSLSTTFFACAAASKPAPASQADAPGVQPADPQSSSGDTAAPAPAVAPAREVGPKPASVIEVSSECIQGASLPEQKECSAPLNLLAEALEQEDSGARDQALSELEACSRFAPGLIRGLRADLGTVSCADALTLPALHSEAELNEPERDLLIALTYAAWLRRSSSAAPSAPTAPNKESLAQYFQTELFPWVTAQAGGIYKIATQAAQLTGYPRGIVATEAGMADLRFVSIVRAVPLPEEIADFPEAVDVYYGNLEQVLDPRKNRGRDAALVGLMALGQQGVIVSERVDAARLLLSQLFGGRRINALDRLIFPSFDIVEAAAHQPAKESAIDQLAISLPTAYFDQVLGVEPLQESSMLLALKQGASPGLQARMQAQGPSPRMTLALGSAFLQLGRTYYSSEYFQLAHQLMTISQDAEKPEKSKGTPENIPLSSSELEALSFQNALALSLMAGPKNAVMLMSQGPRFADARANLVYLEALAQGSSTFSGAAQFDVAYLLELVAPSGAPDHWVEVAQGYENSASLLTGVERQRAQEYGKAARQIAEELTQN